MENTEILFIDDDELIINSLKRQLASWTAKKAVTMYGATSVAEAMKIIQDRKNKIGVIISDQKMPEITGTDLLKVVRNKFPAIVFIMLSGHIGIEDMNSLLDAGVYSFISKPWEKSTLISEINKAIEVWRLRTREQELVKKTEEEIRLAELFQKTFLETELPPWKHGDFFTTYRPSSAMKVGGDYLDSFLLDDGRFLILLGDVSGHGLRPAFMTVILKTFIQTQFPEVISKEDFVPGELLHLLNLECIKLFKNFPDMFLTFMVAVLDADGRGIRYASAGQPPLLHFSEHGLFIGQGTNLVLGVDDIKNYEEHYLPLEISDILFFCSDGIHPSGIRSGGGSERYHKILTDNRDTLTDHRSLLSLLETEGFHSSDEQDDDITILSIRIK